MSFFTAMQSRQDGYAPVQVSAVCAFQRWVEVEQAVPNYEALRAVLAEARQQVMSLEQMQKRYHVKCR